MSTPRIRNGGTPVRPRVLPVNSHWVTITIRMRWIPRVAIARLKPVRRNVSAPITSAPTLAITTATTAAVARFQPWVTVRIAAA